MTEESSYLTTFNTPFGRYRWLRMPFGLVSATEEYQRRINEVLENLAGVKVIVDDILVYGNGDNYEQAVIDHDNNMKALLERLEEKNVKINPNKIKFK